MNFSGQNILNSVLTKNLKINASFSRIFYFKILKISEISNSTGRFSVNRQSQTGPVFSISMKTRPDRFCRFSWVSESIFSLDFEQDTTEHIRVLPLPGHRSLQHEEGSGNSRFRLLDGRMCGVRAHPPHQGRLCVR
jgi:hypothetical protein